ncbi:ABC transporter substrate-binding protein [Anaeromyxobacter oryzisoli]|uniref:ABC transporter substrate-binding protein n=1 Tax=Anaeromyxobacter oryzisoli TaxID=2925408 RepID=UPI001F59E3AD|nr:ABC transporter substrate-binding protein [Anaeromyxobacter sp. SG63]
MSNPIRGLLLALVLALPAGATRAEDVVRVGNLKFVQYGAVSYMKVIGHKYGLKVEEKFFEKGIDVMAQIKAGTIDIGAGATDAAIEGYANGTPLYIVAGLGRGGSMLLSRKSLPIKKIEELKGKKVAVLHGSAQELMLYAELVQHKLTWSVNAGQDVRIVQTRASAEANKLLQAGTVDAVCESDPYASQAISGGFGREIMKPYDTPLGEPVRALVMTKKMYENRDLAQRVLRCFVEATRTFQAQPALAEKYTRETVFGGTLNHQDYADSAANGPLTTDITLNYVQNTAYFMVKYGAGKLPIHPVAADFVRLDLLEAAKRAHGK